MMYTLTYKVGNDKVIICGNSMSIWHVWYLLSNTGKVATVIDPEGALIDCKKGIDMIPYGRNEL